ncbi:MAG: hypothetical protein JNL21_17310 [Myxococcales bacterium]|nr:hypothetical protein [Myxococcales bacterium]
MTRTTPFACGLALGAVLLAATACDQPRPAPPGPSIGTTAAPAPGRTSSAEATGAASASADSAQATSSCDMRGERGTCLESLAEPKEEDAAACENDLIRGKYARVPCPRAGKLGVCLLHDGDRRLYYEGKARDGFDGTVEQARADCEGRNADYAALGKKQTFMPAED